MSQFAGKAVLPALAIWWIAAPSQAQPAAQGSGCTARYSGTLLLAADANGRTMTLAQPYGFTDADCSQWRVPAEAVVDGASIPQALWGLIGGPFEGRYRNASVIHDWYCATRTKPWAEVHKMFYDAMLASGVSERMAKILYWGVYYGGPRWDDLTIRNSRILAGFGASVSTGAIDSAAGPARPPARPPSSKRPAARRVDLTPSMIEAVTAAVDGSNPSIDQLERLADDVSDGKLGIGRPSGNRKAQFVPMKNSKDEQAVYVGPGSYQASMPAAVKAERPDRVRRDAYVPRPVSPSPVERNGPS